MASKGNILIVDDEIQALKLLEYSLKKAFDIRAASSGEEGLEILNSGFNPGVIFSDLMMPGMYGTEFLKRSIDIVPDATRIIVTAHDSPKEIIAAINLAHAYMYIKKPYDSLEIFQAAVVAYDKYENLINSRNVAAFSTENEINQDINSKVDINVYNELNDKLQTLAKEKSELETKFNEVSQLKNNIKEESDLRRIKIEQLEKHIEQMNLEFDENDSFDREAALALSAFVREAERFWFTDHTYNVSVIVKAMVKRMDLNDYVEENTITASLLHNIAIAPMPDYIKFADPNNLNEILRDKYFTHFTRTMKILQKIRRLRRYTAIINQIWEHMDGTGMPNKLPGSKVMLESQIVAIANIYHTNVYSLTIDKYKELLNKGVVAQSKAETEIRHKEALKFFYKKASWFDKIAIQTLHELASDKVCPALIPQKDELVIDLREHYNFGNQFQNVSTSVDAEYDEELMINTDQLLTEEDLVPTEIEASEVKPGMRLVGHLKTINGITIVKADTVLDAEQVKKIKQFDMKGTLSGKVYVLLPAH